ncbi:MAG TPA: hypothetical protein VJI69_09935 [Bacteroidia bacterium]|nr:hypothetical protein [Bacteroidia bacterium]
MTIATLDMISSVNSSALELNYQCQTEQVTYSIADFVGNVMKRGDYNCVKNNKLIIEELPKGTYTLCIIDGDQLSKSRFEKN